VAHYYNQHNSTEPFRYLGYQIIYTIHQRRFLEEQLLSNLKTVVGIYSQRQLSLRGRATVMNTLILTKNWYLLRIFNPTLTFLKKVRQLMYQYVWQNKRSLVAFDQLCLPIAKGGLGLIHPEKQHMVLQKKFLEHIFDQSTIDSAKNIITPLLFSFLCCNRI